MPTTAKVRVMRARRTKGTCPLCVRTMRRGEWICRPGRAWVHRDCWLTRRRNSATDADAV